MNNDLNLKNIIEESSIIENMFDLIRLVDPIKKRIHSVLNKNNSPIIDSQCSNCYSLWGKKTICQNCTSMRALIQNKSIVKIEFNQKSVYMHVSQPLKENNQSLVLELVRDISNDGIINPYNLSHESSHKKIVKENNTVVIDFITKVFNKEYLYERLPYEIHLANNENKTLTLFIIKIKNNEFFEDSYNLNDKNELISNLAKSLKPFVLRNDDWISLYNDFSFVLVMHFLDENKANRVTAKVMSEIEKSDFSIENIPFTPKLAIGKYILENESITPQEFIDKASTDLESLEKSKNDLIKTNMNESFFTNFSISKRERQVATLILEGLSNPEISKKLFISLSTTKKHVSSILLKTGTNSRASFINKFYS